MSADLMLSAKLRRPGREALAYSLALTLLAALPACKSPSAADMARLRARKALLSGPAAKKEWRMTAKRKEAESKDSPLSGIQRRLRHTYRSDGTYATRVGGYAEQGRWKLSGDGKFIELHTKGGTDKRLEILELTASKLVVRDRTELLGIKLVYVLTYEPAAAAPAPTP